METRRVLITRCHLQIKGRVKFIEKTNPKTNPKQALEASRDERGVLVRG